MIDNVEINSLLLRASEFGVLMRPDLRPRLTNSLTTESNGTLLSARPSHLSKGLSVSSMELTSSFNSDGQMTGSTDTINQLKSMLPRPGNDRKRDKGLRLSLPTALNSAGDKIFGKRRSNSASKLKVGVGTAEKKEKGKRKDRLSSGVGLKKSSSRDKLPSLSKSGSLEEGEPADEASSEGQSEPSSDNLEFSGKIVFKPRYTPLSERQQDPWYSGAPDAPLADPEGDSPLFAEPPTRSFPLSHTPNRYTGDYDTAFALASIHGDGLSYLSKVNSVSDAGYRRQSNQDSSELKAAGKNIVLSAVR